MPSCMMWIIRSTSARSSGPNSGTGEARLFSTGSPNLTTWASAASRRSSSSRSTSRSRSSFAVGGVAGGRSSLIAPIVRRAATEGRRRRRSRRPAAPRSAARRSTTRRTAATSPPARSWALTRIRRRWRLRTRNIGAGPSRSDAARAAPARSSRGDRARRPRRACGSLLAGEVDPHQVRVGRVAERLAAVELAGRGSPAESWRGGVLDRGGARRQRLHDHLSPGLAAARSGRPAGRPSRRSAPRRGSRGSAGSRRRRGSSLRVTSGKSWPLATIWVPTRTALGASPNSARMRAWAPRGGGGVGVEAEDRHRRRAARAAAPRSARCRRRPARASSRRTPGRPAARARCGRSGGRRGGRCSRWTISETSQFGQPQWCPQERQVSQGAKPRRLIITIALLAGGADLLQRRPGVGVQRARSAGRPRACRRG